jgi:hypothetical protein
MSKNKQSAVVAEQVVEQVPESVVTDSGTTETVETAPVETTSGEAVETSPESETTETVESVSNGFGTMTCTMPTAAPDLKAIVWSDTLNTSNKIKSLKRHGLTTSQIQKVLNPWYEQKNGRALRYQHVRNVLNTPTKKDLVG